MTFSLNDGEIAWFCKGTSHSRGDLQYSNPIVAGKLCFVTGGYSGPAFTFRMEGSGDITDKSRVWRTEKSPQSIGTGVFIDGYIYRPNAGPATIECIDPATGKVLWKDRGPGANSWGSISVAGDHCYLTGQNGATAVFKPNPKKFELVSLNKIGENSNSTPAIADGRIYLRTFKSVYCFGK